MVKTGFITPMEFVKLMSYNPAEILGNGKGTLAKGAAADIVIIDPDKEHVINAMSFASKGKNTPWHGRKVCGAVEMTIVGGKIVYTIER